MDLKSSLPIGEVARRAGVRASALRYYESLGLLPEAERVGGRRHYPSGVVRRLELIGVARAAGLSLAEVGQLLGGPGGSDAERLRALARRKVPEVEALQERLAAMRAWLEHAANCRCASFDECALFLTPTGTDARAARP